MYNSDCRHIHETIVRDIVDIVSDVKDNDYIAGFAKSRTQSIKSVTAATSNLILTFPVLISNTISIEAAGMIAKAIERKAATLMQILFSAYCVDDAKSAIDYVQKFHTNLNTSNGITVDGLMDALDKYVIDAEESGKLTSDQIRNYEAIKEDLKNLNYTLPDNINPRSLNEFCFSRDSNYPTIVNEYTRDEANALKDTAEYFNKQITSTDIKKANELVPTMMTVRFLSDNGDRTVEFNDIIIGIKAKLYPLDSLDIITRLKLKNQDRNGFNKFIKASTREISFFKDFLFAIDKAKIDALSQSRRGSSSKLWRVLERRSLKSKLRRSLGQSNDASAISTLVVSMEEVEYLKKNDNISIDEPSVMRPIMESYNLMGVVLVDESLEVASFLFDSGDDIYEQVSFNNLEREATDGSYKKMINLMTKMAGR